MEGVEVNLDNRAFNKLKERAGFYKEKYQNLNLSQIEGVRLSRKLFHSLGLDPTKIRPSSESLLRRALKDKGFYSVNNLVDIGNWCSLEFLLPICVYDYAKIVGQILVRKGKPQETYLALNKRELNLENKLVLADDLGPFGSPLSDSLRTAVTLSTKSTLLGLYAPKEYETLRLEEELNLFIQRVKGFCGGELMERRIVFND